MSNKELLYALDYICTEECGCMNELVGKVGMECVENLLVVSLISSGYNPNERTWRVTELGKDFYEEVKP